MIEEPDYFLVDTAAYGLAAMLKHPQRFWLSFWEAMWTT